VEASWLIGDFVLEVCPCLFSSHQWRRQHSVWHSGGRWRGGAVPATWGDQCTVEGYGMGRGLGG
jgi:hypothetical protein